MHKFHLLGKPELPSFNTIHNRQSQQLARNAIKKKNQAFVSVFSKTRIKPISRVEGLCVSVRNETFSLVYIFFKNVHQVLALPAQ